MRREERKVKIKIYKQMAGKTTQMKSSILNLSNSEETKKNTVQNNSNNMEIQTRTNSKIVLILEFKEGKFNSTRI